MTWLFALFAKLYASKGIKIGTVAGGGMMALVMGLHADIKSEITEAELRSKDYTNSKMELMMKETAHLKNGQTDIKDLLRILDKRIYDLNH